MPKLTSKPFHTILLASLAFGVGGCAGTPEEPAGQKQGEAVKKDGEKAPAPAAPIVAPAPAKAAGDVARKPMDPPPEEGGTGGGGGGDKMGDFVREQTLAEQERKALSINYLKSGRQLSLELRYREALPNYERATKLDPTNTEARLEYEKCAWIVGDRLRGEYRDAVREIANERIARVKAAKIEMERLYQEGEILVEKQRYDDSVQRFERVLEALRWFPYEIDPGQAYKKKTEDAINKARALQSQQEARRREALQDASKRDAENKKALQVQYAEAILRQLKKEAHDAFDNKRWDKCRKLCNEILARRPSDTEIRKLRDEADDAHKRDFSIQTYKDKVEHYRRQLQWLQEEVIPFQQLFNFPDADAWAEVSRREVLAFRRFSDDQAGGEDAQEINRRLDSQKINLNFDDTPFQEAIDTLHDLTSLNFVVQTSAKDLIENEGIKIRLKVRDITVRNALNLIMAQKEDLIYVIKNGVVLISTKGSEPKQLFLEFYDVSDIINKTPDFPAPELGLPSGQGAGGRGQGMTGGVLTFGDDKKGNTGVGVDADKLRELVDSKLGEAADDGGSVEISGGVLIVRKSAEAHKKIQRLLEALRKTVGIMVTIEARFVDIQDNFLEQIGIDFVNQPDSANYPPPGFPNDTFGSINRPRGNQGPNDSQVGYSFTDRSGDYNQRASILNLLSNPLGSIASNPFNISNSGGLALQWNYIQNFQLQAVLEAIRKKQKARQINAPRVQVFNGQRAHMLAIKQRAYIQGVEVNQTGVIPVLNPIIGILNTGSILEV